MKIEQKVVITDFTETDINEAIQSNKGWIVSQLVVNGDYVIILFTKTTIS